MDVYARLEELGITLPDAFPSLGTFVPCVRTGNLVFVGGHLPFDDDDQLVVGRLGEDLDVDKGYEIARGAARSALASLHAELGDLNRVQRVVRVYGVVNATPDFQHHTPVIDGASDLLTNVFGEAGQHVRLAVGVASLPAGIALEIELVVEVTDEL